MCRWHHSPSIYCLFFSLLHFLLADFLLLLRYSLLMSSFYFAQLLLLVSFFKVEKLRSFISVLKSHVFLHQFGTHGQQSQHQQMKKYATANYKPADGGLVCLFLFLFSFLFLFFKDISKVNFKTLFDRNMATDPWVDYKENLMLSRVITGTTCCFPGVSGVQRLL